MGLCLYIVDNSNHPGDTETSQSLTSRDSEGGVPAIHMVTMSRGPPLSRRVSLEWSSSPTLLFESFTELAGQPPLQDGLLCGQEMAAQFEPQKKPVRQQIHRMFLLRVKLMHFVNSLHNYIMTRVRICL